MNYGNEIIERPGAVRIVNMVLARSGHEAFYETRYASSSSYAVEGSS